MARGPDISEHQGSFPGGAWDFVIIRLVNENGRVDFRWRQHKAEADRRGIPAGAYIITQPGRVEAGATATRFLHELYSTSWGLIPTVDVELPGPNLVGYTAVVRDVIKTGTGVPIMGYYSARSSYRTQTQHLFDRHWLASWGAPFPAGAHIHQYQGSPLDLNFAHDLAPVRWQEAPAPRPPAPKPVRRTMVDMYIVNSGGDDDKWYEVWEDRMDETSPESAVNLIKSGVPSKGEVHPLVIVKMLQDRGVVFPPA